MPSAPMNPDIQPLKETATEYHATDRSNSKWFTRATLHPDGSLTFRVVRQDSGGESSIQGHEFFDAMMNHFGDAVRVIVGQWVDAPGNDSNLRLFNEKTKEGLSNEEAAFHTKTGRWAKQWGYSSIGQLDASPDDFPGGYEQVLIEFQK